MNGKPKIPKGWRKLKRGMLIMPGDKFFFDVTRTWHQTRCAGQKIGEENTAILYIRKQTKNKSK